MDNHPSPKVGIPYADPEVRIKPEDEVKVMVYDRFGTLVHTYTARGMHNITEAVEAANAPMTNAISPSASPTLTPALPNCTASTRTETCI